MPTDCTTYDFSTLEPHWQARWLNAGTFRATQTPGKPKYYILDMFPYPSGAGLHIGHPEGYTASDILARYKRACGYNVLHPMGWDAFGLPAEQHAIATGQHPATNTAANIANFRRQIQAIGFAIDWTREIDTTDPQYFRWTQWIFLQLFKHGLAYVDDKPVWWCPALGTVLANEEVLNTQEGPRSERGQHPVERRPLRQWVLRITAYADKLLEGLPSLDWPDSTSRMQQAWIGRSEGAEVLFSIQNHSSKNLTVYTTRPDTLFGATYVVLAPEHPLVADITTPEQRDTVNAYLRQAASKSDLERTDLAKDKTGVFTGAYAINPVNGTPLPIWIADYVLISYGTGAIMAVPAHDERDHAFALKFDLPIVEVIQRPKDAPPQAELPCYTGPGTMTHSGQYDGMDSESFKRLITETLAAQGQGKAAVNYKLRDWLFSRQRYWGEPFPILWVSLEDYGQIRMTPDSRLLEFLPQEPVTFVKDGQTFAAVPLPESSLPLLLPEVASYQPTGTGESPLANARDWVHVWLNTTTGETLPASQPIPVSGKWIRATRETNTMPQWAGSCWYHLRYLDPHNDKAPLSREAEAFWGMPDFYIGGAEHAVLHLLYARFWHRFLYDIGVVTHPEPFQRLFHQGIILGEDGQKMSKSRGNVVSPDTIIAQYGADALRLFEMFLGPLEAMKPWNTSGIEGIARFLRKCWREILDENTGQLHARYLHDRTQELPETERLLHETIKKVTEDFEHLRFNTAISQLMIFVNHLGKTEQATRATAATFVQLLAPLAPHLAEELWERLGHPFSVCEAPWPKYDPALLVSDTLKLVLQVNGKWRGEMLVARDTPQETILAAARAHERIAPMLEGKTLAKEIFVPGKLVNLVVR